MKLFMVLVGCRPEGRNTEQHDIFFGIAAHVRDLIPALKAWWPEAKGKIHVDAWREVTYADGYEITVTEREISAGELPPGNELQLYFLNLGGYKPMEFEEYHYKMVVAAISKAHAIKQAKTTAFYKHTGYAGAESHIDDKFGIDIDDMALIKDILETGEKEKYQINLHSTVGGTEDELHIGYYKLDRL